MLSMFKQFFSMFGSLFLAGDTLAKGLVVVSESTLAMAEGYKAEQEYERRSNGLKLQAKIRELERSIALAEADPIEQPKLKAAK